MIVVIDNFDSFTFNLVQMLGARGQELRVFRNDAIDADGIRELAPQLVVLSPGPGRPEDAGNMPAIISALHIELPMLGICLGHQALAMHFGASIVRAGRLMHGRTSLVYHDGHGVHRGLPNPYEAMRYHSLVVDPASLPDCLELTAHTSHGEVMAIRHRELPLVGLQFHPESLMTAVGPRLVDNLLAQLAPAEVLR
ncbi:MAG: aminodeoxychorismate/anthranilate synthase component II [Planctomycetales bacterium]|nr:aminodeoxychorismate/anthranilate synthase component II [bacterium]UNM06940.1 MAG: aminodeoxychorismate/anthranilate synthase component II [Planctomycetales bacterium]